MSNLVSVSYTPKPSDSRCRYWAKIIRAEQSVPAPASVDGASSLPAEYLRSGDEVELFEGDAILEGEANSHRRNRGWSYNIGVVKNSKLEWYEHAPTKRPEIKQHFRDTGNRSCLMGSGDIAAMVRLLHYIRETSER